MDGAPLLFFPVNVDPARAEAYASRYLYTVQFASSVDMQVDEGARQALVKRAVGPRPATLDAEPGLQALPPAQQRLLAQKQRSFLLFWQQIYPLLDGETLLAEQVTFTAEAWAGYPPHILFYERKTDQGELALVLPYVHIDPQTGQLYNQTAAYGALPELFSISNQAQLGSAADGFDIMQSVLGMITWVGMGMGPEGMVLAAVAGIFEIIFSLFRPKGSNVDLPKVVHDILKRDLAEDHILKNVTTILTYINWLSQQNQVALQGTMSGLDPKKYQDAVADLKRYISDACNPSMPLLQAIGDLQRGNYPCDPSYQILSLAAFLLGASTHLLFEKCRILFLTDATTFRSPVTYELVNVAKDYLAHTQNVVAQIEGEFKKRLDGIHDPKRMHVRDLSGRMYYVYLYITDDHADLYPEQETKTREDSLVEKYTNKNVVWSKDCESGGCCSDFNDPNSYTCDMGAAAVWKAEYVARITSTLETKYNYPAERRADTHNVIAELEKVIRQFEPLTR
jgi:hypothetical protein